MIREKYSGTSLLKIITISNKLITMITFISYPILLCLLLLKKDVKLLRFILIPGIAFAAISIFRHIINRQRPYEKWGIKPLIPRDKAGKSFPSRHVFSIFIIAMLWLHISLPFGIFLLCAGLLLAFIRVFTGIHYISDVAVGALVGILCGIASILPMIRLP